MAAVLLQSSVQGALSTVLLQSSVHCPQSRSVVMLLATSEGVESLSFLLDPGAERESD